MALRIIEGFDHCSTSALLYGLFQGGVATYGAPVAGRFGGNSIPIGARYYRLALNQSLSTWIIGVAYCQTGVAISGSNDKKILQLTSNGNAQCDLVARADTRSLQLQRDGNVVATSASNVLPDYLATPVPSSWCYIEWKVTIGASAYYEIRVNGVNVLSGTGNTKTQTESTANYLYIGHEAQTTGMRLDDLYVCDATGGVYDDFIGPCLVDTFFPTADNSVMWTRNTGASNFSAIDDTPYNLEVTNYVLTHTPGDTDTYTVGTFSDLGDNIAVQLNIFNLSEYDTNDMSISGVVNVGGTDYPYSGTFLIDSVIWAKRIGIWTKNPLTTGDWTVTELNATKFGFKLV